MADGALWPLVGRDDELVLGGAAVAGRGCLLAGPAGVGKTRLARELAGRDGSRSWSQIVASPGTSDVPLGAFAHLLPADWRVSGDQHATWRQLGRSLGLGSEGAAGLLVDDAHWLDDLSAGFVHHVASTGQATLVVTVRAGEPAPTPVVALWKDALLARVEVQPLGPSDIARLLEAVLGAPVEPRTANRYTELSAGNVLWLRELVDGALASGSLRMAHGAWVELTASPSPLRLGELLADRFAHLPEAERRVPEVLALSGPLPWDVATALFDGDVIASLEGRRIVEVGEDGQLGLGHPLYADVLLPTIGEARRRLLRGQLIRAFADVVVAPDAATAMRVAIWHIDGQVPIPPAQALAAADTALEMTAHLTAERLARAAVVSGAGGSGMLRVGESVVRQHRHSEASKVLSTIDPAELQPSELVRFAIARSAALGGAGGRFDEAVAALESVIAAMPEDEFRRQVQAHLAWVLVDQGRLADGGALGTTLLAAAEADGDEPSALRAMVPATIAMTVAGRCRDALGVCDRMEVLALEHIVDLPEAIGWVFARRLHALEAAGDLPAAEVLIDLIEQLVVAEHDPSVEAGALLARAIVASHRGTVRDGARLFSLAAALHRVDDRRGTLPWCLAGQAKMLAQLGDEAGATIAMEEAWAERWVDGQVFDTDLYVADAWVRWLRGDLQGAFAQLDVAIDEAANQDLVQLEGYVRHEAVRLGAHPGAHADRLAELAPQSQGLWDGAWAQHAVALAAQDAQALEAAADAFVTIGLDLLAAEAFAEAASTWTADGLPARAAAAAQRSRSRLELCQGAITPALTRLDKAVALLTPREIEVATRAARGLASADIAEELRLSVRTVETHLQRAFVKLGVNRRQQLAAILVPQSRA